MFEDIPYIVAVLEKLSKELWGLIIIRFKQKILQNQRLACSLCIKKFYGIGTQMYFVKEV